MTDTGPPLSAWSSRPGSRRMPSTPSGNSTSTVRRAPSRLRAAMARGRRRRGASSRRRRQADRGSIRGLYSALSLRQGVWQARIWHPGKRDHTGRLRSKRRLSFSLALDGRVHRSDRRFDGCASNAIVVGLRVVHERHSPALRATEVDDPMLNLRAHRTLIPMTFVDACIVACDSDHMNGHMPELPPDSALRCDGERPPTRSTSLQLKVSANSSAMLELREGVCGCAVTIRTVIPSFFPASSTNRAGEGNRLYEAC